MEKYPPKRFLRFFFSSFLGNKFIYTIVRFFACCFCLLSIDYVSIYVFFNISQKVFMLKIIDIYMIFLLLDLCFIYYDSEFILCINDY